jgi:hypothetical protein
MQREVQGYLSSNSITVGGRPSNYYVSAGAPVLSLSYRHAVPTFGLNIENHTVKTRRLWHEVDYLEFSVATDSMEVYTSAGSNFVSGHFVALFDWIRVGVSLHSDERYALSAIAKIVDGVAIMGELGTHASLAKLSWNLLPGLWLYIQADGMRPGAGMRWAPIQHLEIEGLIEEDRAWALGHIWF